MSGYEIDRRVGEQRTVMSAAVLSRRDVRERAVWIHVLNGCIKDDGFCCIVIGVAGVATPSASTEEDMLTLVETAHE